MSSPPLRVFLNTKEDRSLWELTQGTEIPQKVKERVQVLRLSSRGWKVEKIAVYMKWSKTTVGRTLKRWQAQGEKGLWDKPRIGRPRTWQSEDLEVVESALKEERSYSSRQLCQILMQERKLELSERHLRRILKKKLLMEKNKSLNKGEARPRS